MPYTYTLEGDVEDVSRQHIANRTSLLVHPAPWYIGVRRVPLFNEQRDGLKTELVAVGLDGKPVPGVRDRRQADAGAVAERAPRGRQRLLRLGDAAHRSARGRVEGDQRGRRRCR